MPARRVKQHRAQVLPAVNRAGSHAIAARARGPLITGMPPGWVNCLSHVVGYVGVSPSETPGLSPNAAKSALAGRDWVNAVRRSRGLGPLGGGLPIPARSRAGC